MIDWRSDGPRLPGYRLRADPIEDQTDDRIALELVKAAKIACDLERESAVRFIRAIAGDASMDSRASDELFRVAKSIEAGFHRVIR